MSFFKDLKEDIAQSVNELAESFDDGFVDTGENEVTPELEVNPDTLLEIRKSHLFHAIKHHKIPRNCAGKPIQRIQAPAQPIAPLSRHPIEKPGESICQQDKNQGKNGSIKKLLLKCHVAPFPVIHNYEHNQCRKDIEFHI